MGESCQHEYTNTTRTVGAFEKVGFAGPQRAMNGYQTQQYIKELGNSYCLGVGFCLERIGSATLRGFFVCVHGNLCTEYIKMVAFDH